MDYIFFAFSSLCVMFCVILAVMLAGGRALQPRALLIILAAAAGGAFYFLETTYAGKSIAFYYTANIIPQVVLALLLGLYLSRGRKA